MTIRAVLTGDVVNSTRLERAVEKNLLKVLQGILQPYKFEFYRGDSFQVYMKEPAPSLRIALLCRTAAISIAEGKESIPCDIRISIGIGTVITPVRALGSAKGEAFVLSGRAFDDMQKADKRISIANANNIANTGLQVITDYVDAIYKEMTAKQAEVIFELLKGETQQRAADILKKSKSTVSQLVSSARWSAIERLLEQYENLIKQLV